MPRLHPPLAPTLLALFLWAAAAAPATARSLATAAAPPASSGGPLANLTAARDAVRRLVDASGPLSVCVSAFRPYTTIRNGSYSGMDIEIWRRMARDLELEEGADYEFTPFAAFEVGGRCNGCARNGGGVTTWVWRWAALRAGGVWLAAGHRGEPWPEEQGWANAGANSATPTCLPSCAPSLLSRA